MEYTTNSPEETEALGASMGARLKAGTVVAFTGDLGRARLLLSGAWPGGSG